MDPQYKWDENTFNVQNKNKNKNKKLLSTLEVANEKTRCEMKEKEHISKNKKQKGKRKKWGWLRRSKTKTLDEKQCKGKCLAQKNPTFQILLSRILLSRFPPYRTYLK